MPKITEFRSGLNTLGKKQLASFFSWTEYRYCK